MALTQVLSRADLLPSPEAEALRTIYYAYNRVAEAPEAREAPYLDLNDVPLLAGETDDRLRFQRALAQADYVRVTPRVGGGDWTIQHFPDIEGKYVNVVGGKTIKGSGMRAPIVLLGGDGLADANAGAFVVQGDQRDVIFEDLYGVGENGSWDDPSGEAGDYGMVENFFSGTAFIEIVGDAFSNFPRNVTIRRCQADFMYGFSFHDLTSGSHGTSVLDCLARYCGNGINVCSDHSLQIGNRIEHGEGFEMTGKGAIMALNSLVDARGSALVYGGSTLDMPGGIVGFNSVESCTGSVINIGDGVRNLQIIGNYVGPIAPGHYAVRFAAAFGEVWWPRDVQVLGNTMYGLIDPSVYGGLWLGNTFMGGVITAMICRFPDQVIDHNRFKNVTRPMEPNPSGIAGTAPTNIFFGPGNQYAPFEFYEGSGGVARFAEGSHFRVTVRLGPSEVFRGCTQYLQGGAGTADRLERCQKNAANAYEWRQMLGAVVA